MTTPALIPTRLLRALSVELDADPRTIRRVLLGAELTTPARRRIAKVLRARGYMVDNERELGIPALRVIDGGRDDG